MQAIVTVITITVLQEQSNLQASLPSYAVTVPGLVQNIYLNFANENSYYPLTFFSLEFGFPRIKQYGDLVLHWGCERDSFPKTGMKSRRI